MELRGLLLDLHMCAHLGHVHMSYTAQLRLAHVYDADTLTCCKAKSQACKGWDLESICYSLSC